MAFNMHSITEMDLNVALNLVTRDPAEAHAYGSRSIDDWFALEDAEATNAASKEQQASKVSSSNVGGIVENERVPTAAVAAAAAVLGESEKAVTNSRQATRDQSVVIQSDIDNDKQGAGDQQSAVAGEEDENAMSVDVEGGVEGTLPPTAPARLSDAEEATISALLTLSAAQQAPLSTAPTIESNHGAHTPAVTMHRGDSVEQPPHTPGSRRLHASGRRTQATPGAAALREAMDKEQREGDTPESSPVPFAYARQNGAQSDDGDDDFDASGFEDVIGGTTSAVENGISADSSKINKKRKLAGEVSDKPAKRTKPADNAKLPMKEQTDACGDHDSVDDRAVSPNQLENGNATKPSPIQAQKSTPPKERSQAQSTRHGPTRKSTLANELKALAGVVPPKKQRAVKQTTKPKVDLKNDLKQAAPRKSSDPAPVEVSVIGQNTLQATHTKSKAATSSVGQLEQMLPGIDAYVGPKSASMVPSKLAKSAVAAKPKAKTQRRSARVSDVTGEEVKPEGGEVSKVAVGSTKTKRAGAEPANKTVGRPAKRAADAAKGAKGAKGIAGKAVTKKKTGKK